LVIFVQLNSECGNVKFTFLTFITAYDG